MSSALVLRLRECAGEVVLRGRWLHPVAGVLCTLFLIGCEKPFEPLAPSELAFSIYGHLDATADTQWVRVMPIRESLDTRPEPIDAVVTLEEIETGTAVVMSDSMSRYLPMFLGDVDLFAHNFFTTMPLVPGRHYRLTATRSDGAAASATVLIPVFEPPTLELRNAFSAPSNPGSSAMRPTQGMIRGARYLGMVLSREDVPSACGFSFPIHQEFLPVIRPAALEGEGHEVQMAWGEARPSYVQHPPPCSMGLGPKRILAVASAEPWIYGATAQHRVLSHPATINNIEGRGVGFVIGVQTQTFPFAWCTPLVRTSPCTITFSPRSATLVGVVTHGCTGVPIDEAHVRLVGVADNAIRYDTADASGVFKFQGLEPGATYSVRISHQFVTYPPPIGRVLEEMVNYFPFEMDLVFAEAAVDTVAMGMIHEHDWATGCTDAP